jgi:beta-phosphoglucomutase-like phosphatase (HAD superfamily)
MSQSAPALAPRQFTLPLPEGEFHAYLFDCDGTVVDSMPLHYLAWRRALDAHGCDFPEELFYEWGGKPVDQILTDLSRAQGLSFPIAETAHIKEGYFHEAIPQLTAVAEVLEHIEDAHGRIPFAIVSGGGRDSVVRSLDQLGLLDRFDTLVCAEDYTRAKPDPEPYLIAAQRLNVAPGHCLVFEDTDLGIAAATAAGMKSIKVPHPLERQRR